MKKLIILTLSLLTFNALAEIEIISGFDVFAQSPIDSRIVTANLTAVSNFPTIIRYDGLMIYVQDIQKFYCFSGGIADANLTEFAGGGGGGTEYIAATNKLSDDLIAYIDSTTNAVLITANNYTDSATNALMIEAEDLFVNEAGDDMTGILGMGGNKITNVAAGVDGNDAVNYNQLTNVIGNASETSFDGDRTIKQVNGALGKNMETTNVVGFLNAVFFPFIDATISLNVSPSLVEEGTRQTVTCSGTVTANDETGFSVAYVDPSTGANMPFTAQAGAYSVQQTDVLIDSTYRSYITTANIGAINSSERSINFVYPYFWAMNATDLTTGGSAFYAAIAKQIQTLGTKTPTLNGSGQYIYFAYPTEYPDLTSIRDQNSFEQISSFTKYEVSVTSTGLDTDWTHNYKIYRCNGLTTVNNGQYTFTH